MLLLLLSFPSNDRRIRGNLVRSQDPLEYEPARVSWKQRAERQIQIFAELAIRCFLQVCQQAQTSAAVVLSLGHIRLHASPELASCCGDIDTSDAGWRGF